MFSSSLMHRSTLIKPLPPSFLFTYNLSTSLFGCNPPYITIVFLDFLSKSFSSLAFHWIIPTPCLNIATAHVFIAVTLFLPFNLDFKINLCLRLYSLVIFSFISVSLILSNSIIPKYVYPYCPTCFITSPSSSLIPLFFTILPLFIVRIPHFFIRNSMPMSVLSTYTVLTIAFVFSSRLAHSFKSSTNNK